MAPADNMLPGPGGIPAKHPKRKHLTGFNYNLRVPMRASRKTAIRNHFVAATGEYVGTTLFLFFALGGTNVANVPSTSVSPSRDVNTSQIQFIALAFGFSLATNAWVFFRISGGLFNPAVSLGLAIVGAITPLRALILTIAQILGGITGSALILAILPGTLNVRTTLSNGTSVAQGLFLEMFLTAMLMLTIFLLAAEKHKATFLAPIGIGLSLFIAELVGVFYTGGSLNPARSFGPDVVLGEFAHYHWIYWLGPALGALLAAGFYKFIKYMQYETVNAAQDAAEDTPMLAQAGAAKRAKVSGTTTPLPGAGGNVEMVERPGGKKPSMVSRMSSSIMATVGRPVTPAQNVGTGEEKENLTSTLQGPGLSDLLTEAPVGTQVYELNTDRNHHQDGRLSSMENKLDQLLAAMASSSRGSGVGGGTHTPNNRMSIGQQSVIEEEGTTPLRHLGDDQLFGNERLSQDESSGVAPIRLGHQL